METEFGNTLQYSLGVSLAAWGWVNFGLGVASVVRDVRDQDQLQFGVGDVPPHYTPVETDRYNMYSFFF